MIGFVVSFWLVCGLVSDGIVVGLWSRWLVCGGGVDERVVVVWRCGRQSDKEIGIRNKW